MSNYNAELQSNNAELQEILNTVNELPEASSGEGGSTEAEKMMLTTADNWDGNDFYSLFLWLEVTQTNFSEYPFMYSAMNNHPTLYLHLYIVANIRYVSDDGETFEDLTEYYILTIPPDQGENSIEIDGQVLTFNIQGIRWSTDGV